MQKFPKSRLRPTPKQERGIKNNLYVWLVENDLSYCCVKLRGPHDDKIRVIMNGALSEFYTVGIQERMAHYVYIILRLLGGVHMLGLGFIYIDFRVKPNVSVNVRWSEVTEI